MKLGNLINRYEIKSFFFKFKEALKKFVGDPLLSQIKESDIPEKATNPQVVTALVIVTGMSFVTNLLRAIVFGESISWISSLILVPLMLVVASFIGFVFMMVLGFKGDFKKYVGIVLYEWPLIISAYSAFYFLGLFEYGVIVYINSILLILTSLFLTYRFFLLSQISKKRIQVVLSVLFVIQVLGFIKIYQVQNTFTQLEQYKKNIQDESIEKNNVQAEQLIQLQAKTLLMLKKMEALAQTEREKKKAKKNKKSDSEEVESSAENTEEDSEELMGWPATF